MTAPNSAPQTGGLFHGLMKVGATLWLSGDPPLKIAMSRARYGDLTVLPEEALHCRDLDAFVSWFCSWALYRPDGVWDLVAPVPQLMAWGGGDCDKCTNAVAAWCKAKRIPCLIITYVPTDPKAAHTYALVRQGDRWRVVETPPTPQQAQEHRNIPREHWMLPGVSFSTVEASLAWQATRRQIKHLWVDVPRDSDWRPVKGGG